MTDGGADKQVGDVPFGSNVGLQIGEANLVYGSCSSGDVGAPHPALSFTLDCLGVRDLIAAESVCRSLRSTVAERSALVEEYSHRPIKAHLKAKFVKRSRAREELHTVRCGQCLKLKGFQGHS